MLSLHSAIVYAQAKIGWFVVSFFVRAFLEHLYVYVFRLLCRVGVETLQVRHCTLFSLRTTTIALLDSRLVATPTLWRLGSSISYLRLVSSSDLLLSDLILFLD